MRIAPSPADRVLEAALKLFWTYGYSSTTIEDIKLQSDVSIGVIYHHFGSKEGIAGALYVQSLHDFQRGLIRALDRRRAGTEAGVRAGVGHYLRWADENRARAAFMLRRRETEATQTTHSDVQELNERLFEELEIWYRPRVSAGEIADLPMPLLLSIWFGPAHEFARSVIDGPWSGRGRRLVEAEPVLAGAAWAALAP